MNNILSFGNGSIAESVRLLGTTATSKNRPGRPPGFTKAGVKEWASQLDIHAEARIISQKKEHRRFILLDRGQSLILGPSLNSLHKNEAISIEDDNEDRPFFDQKWIQSVPLD